MMNLFSIFDPSTSLILSLNWISLFMIFFLLPFQFWIIPSRYIILWMYLIKYLFKEFKILILYSYSNMTMFISLFFMIFFNNLLGLFPYIFTASSHMNLCFSISLSFWLGMIIYTFINYFNNLMTHMTPQGTPIILMSFMVLIESISLIIRPLTLAIRLTANMIAGHLLLSLLGNTGILINNSFFFIMLTFSQILLYTLEISVSIIQAYVFSTLLTLYSSES